MKKVFFCFLLLTCFGNAFAEELPSFLAKEEMELSGQLSKRRQELDKRSEELNAREKDILKKEKLYQNTSKDTFNAAPLPRQIQLYMQMKPAKAAALLDKKPLSEANDILKQMPPVYAGRILNQMTDAKAAALIEKTPLSKE